MVEEIKGEPVNQPQEDKFLLAQSHLQTLSGCLDSIQQEDIVNNCNQKLQNVDDFEHEIMKDCQSIKEKIEEVRAKVESQRKTPTNINGFLVGELDEYIGNFDYEIEKIQNRLNKDRAHWHQHAKNSK